MDSGTVAAIAGLLALILLTGYLIIYNVFQISVAGDIRFYGMLKTIGTTPRQLRRIIRRQALTLSLFGIPLGLLLGWGIGALLVPVVVKQLSGVVSTISVSPLIFVIAALFSLVTVLLSCAKPGRMSNVVEVKSRGASVLALATESRREEMEKNADAVLTIPDTEPMATHSSGLMPLKGSEPVMLCTSSCTAGMRLEPPTISTLPICEIGMPESLMAWLTGSRVACTR